MGAALPVSWASGRWRASAREPCTNSAFHRSLVKWDLGVQGPHDPVDLSKVRRAPYLVNRLIHKFPKMSAHIERELRTNCEAMDQLGEGRPAGAADLMMQRVTALESTLRGDSWALAGQQEITDDVDGLTSLEERHMAGKQWLKQLQLEAASKKVSSEGAG